MPQLNRCAQQAQECEKEALEFNQETLPWVDRASFQMELTRRLTAGRITPGEAQRLRKTGTATNF